MNVITIKKFVIMLCSFLLCFSDTVSNADPLPVADFAKSGLDGWETRVFKGRTTYQLVRLKDTTVLMADSRDSASGLFKKIDVDLKKYPFLNWSWRIENRLDIKNERIKPGDDYAARIYMVISGGILPWRNRAVNYVWADKASKGEIWPNPFAGKNVMMMAVRSRRDKTSTWYLEKRNVYEDLKRVFGTEFHTIDAIAVMTDTDNSHGRVKSYYGDIYFSSK